jgi:hypothetical protein
MSTGHTPNPPDHLTTQATQRDVQGQDAGSEQLHADAQQQPLSLGADIARILEEQVDIIAQKQIYHSQMMVGVAALGSDPVNARNTVLTIATALRNEGATALEHSLVKLADPQAAQINDRTLPYRFNAQMAGMLEGILIQTVSEAYGNDPTRLKEARLMLERLFAPANEEMQSSTKAPPSLQAPAMGRDRRQIAAPSPDTRS